MHTETDHNVPAVPAYLRSEDTTMAVRAAWTLGLVVFTLAGFYFGTIAVKNNHPEPPARHTDLSAADLPAVIPYIVGGLSIGVVFAIIVTFLYVPYKLREIEIEDAAHSH